MKRAKDVGVNCLVHCSMGISRSSTVLTSFIMHTTGVGYDEALKIVKDARSCAEPNAGFADQLRYFHLSGDLKSDI
jgi:protein-tyrosine phosphatase